MRRFGSETLRPYTGHSRRQSTSDTGHLNPIVVIMLMLSILIRTIYHTHSLTPTELKSITTHYLGLYTTRSILQWNSKRRFCIREYISNEKWNLSRSLSYSSMTRATAAPCVWFQLSTSWFKSQKGPTESDIRTRVKSDLWYTQHLYRLKASSSSYVIK